LNSHDEGNHAPKRYDLVPASEALRIFDVKKQTLYAYVSRGWVRSVKQPGARQRLYSLDDIRKLKARSEARSGYGPVAAAAMSWGAPIIRTSITEITPKGPQYRARLAVDLARERRTFEAVAQYIWTGVLHEEPVVWEVEPLPLEITRLVESVSMQSNDFLLEVFSLFILNLGMSRGSAFERVKIETTYAAAIQAIQVLVGCMGFASAQRRFAEIREGQRIVEGLARAFDIEQSDDNLEALQAILVLLADHELSPDAFTARIAASAGAAIDTCIAAAICTSTGTEVGRLHDRVERLLHSASTEEGLMQQARDLHARGETIAGFGHPLYPKGDPRAYYLLELAEHRSNQSDHLKAALRFVRRVGIELDLFPRHETGVATLTLAMGAPRGCGAALFVLARIAGWTAHVAEQRLTGTYLRPRARFMKG